MKDIFQSDLFVKIRDFFSALSDKFQKSYTSWRTPGKKVIIIGFVALVIVLAAFSAVILIDENSPDSDVSTTRAEEIDPAVLNSSNRQSVEGSFLFALTDTEKTNVLSLIKVDFSSEDSKLIYDFISPSAYVSISGTSDSLSGHFASGGTNQLMLALSEHTGAEFDRYVIGDESSFYHLMQLLGDTTVEIENRVSYDHNGVSFIIEEGTQTLTPDMMLKYYLYLINRPEANADKIIGIIIDCLERLVTCADDTELESDFCTAIGYFDTNVSALDFSNNKELLKALPGMNLKEKAQRPSDEEETLWNIRD